MSRTAPWSLWAVLLAAPAVPDEVFLRGGGRVSGVIVERTRDAVSIETAPGRLTLSMRRVEKIVEGRSAVEEFQERAAALAPGDAVGWAALARWAAERDLVTHSREAWQRVLAVDPSHPEANAALGRVELDGAWVSEGEAYRARGYVEYEGRWVTPAEHETLVRERAAEAAAALETREAEIRVREAEARAREAEARAREAEAAAQPVDEGIPLWWGWGGGYGYVPSFPLDPGHHPHHPPTRQPRPPGQPRPRPQPPHSPHPSPHTPPASRPTSVIPAPPSGPLAPSNPATRPERPSGRPSEIGSTRPD
ncbi:MAG TPA: hypothetical protein VLL75_17500 [Vicinamibacteria bacterium]|nr:hypothetical protein [Vicinamibacteria bacterium]